MNRGFPVGIVLGGLVGLLIVLLTGKVPNTGSVEATSESPPATDEASIGSLLESRNQFQEYSGKWISINGEHSFELTLLHLELGRMGAWTDLENQEYWLGQHGKFLTKSGFYTLWFDTGNRDSLSLIREDRNTGEFWEIYLYRERCDWAAAREPLGPVDLPPQISGLLAGIADLAARAQAAYLRVRLLPDQKLTPTQVFARSQEDGRYEVWGLGLGEEWMLEVEYSWTGLLIRVRVVRGYRDGPPTRPVEIVEHLYPYFADDRIYNSMTDYRAAPGAGK